ncbi:hypothetical protein JX265_010517 [Neoarthrinium moseri]|uniref:Uncharacterized protein n=1 Tax=Neoarthrinium moseri TaxID=1658444 RepID=A0A9P9WE64_9PEZI|nr:hypothetical protein JX265_010517 [Neoarthrinium moseri]
MEIDLQSPSPPTFKNVTVLGKDGHPIFKVEGTAWGTSWSWRRKLIDSAGHHVCDFRHNSFDIKNGWTVEGPSGQKIVSLVHTAFLKKGHAAVTATVRTTAGEDVSVEMSPRDRAALLVTIEVGGSTIASITKIADNRYVFGDPRDRSVWNVNVAAGVDLSLVMIMAMCRAEMGHVWKD